MSDKRTPWFGVMSQPPVRHGWYEWRNHRWSKKILRCYWNGETFSFGGKNKVCFATLPHDQWRGLAERSE